VTGLSISGATASDYVLASNSVTGGIGDITPATLTGEIIGNPSKIYDGTDIAKLAPDNFELIGFVAGQGGTVTQTSGTYASTNVGPENVTADITGDITPNSGTDLANYILPSIVTGEGTISGNNLNSSIIADYRGSESAEEILANAHAAMLPEIVIPFPAPAGLFTRGGGIFGSLPTIIQNTPPVPVDGDIGATAGQPLTVSPEEILLQGDRNKTWWIILPETRPIQAPQIQ